MKKITHIVANGCSWTYGHNLPEPTKNAWPALVAKEFNLPIVNLALPGSSNTSILRRTTEYLFQNLSTGSRPLVIIAWSQMSRREGWNKEFGVYEEIHIGPDQDISTLNAQQLCHLENYDFRDHCRRNLLYKISLQSILERLNIPYVMGYYSHQDRGLWEFNEIGIETKQKYKEMYEYTHNKDNYYWDIALSSVATNCKKLPCGHEDFEGHSIIANYVIDFIKTKHNLVYEHGSYLELKNFENLQNNSYFEWY